MGEHAESEHVDMLQCDHQVPEEVSGCHALNHSSRSSVAPNPFLPAHILALLIYEHNPQGEEVNRCALHQRYDVHIPVDLALGGELWVADRKQPC